MTPIASTKGSALAQGASGVEEALREAVILATLIFHPPLIARFESALERMELIGTAHERLRGLILSA